MKNTRLYANLVAATLAGCLLPLAFSPYHIWPLAIVSPALLFWTWQPQGNVRYFFTSAWLFGIGKFTFGIYWVFISIHRFGGSNIIVAGTLTALLVLLIGLFQAVQGLLYYYLRNKRLLTNSVFLFPATFVFSEWLLTWLFTGFPWLLLGTSQIDSALAGYTPIFGVLGTSFICALMAGLIVCVIKENNPGKKFVAIFIFILTFVLGAYASNIQWSKPTQNALSVALVQGNIPQNLHWQPDYIAHIMETYKDLSQAYFHHSQLIVWPENAIPMPPPYSDAYLLAMDKKAQQTNTTLLLGLPIIHDKGYYNSIMMLGAKHGHYYKRHLVPFGEYLPFSSLLQGLINFFNLPMSNFIAGPQRQPLFQVNGQTIAPMICYEVAYPMLVHADLPKATMLLSISNDSWFGRSDASWQQLQSAQALSLASGRPQLAATNNGITAVIDHKGNITHKLARDRMGVLHTSLYGDLGVTPWIMWGRWPVLILIFAIFIFCASKRYMRSKQTTL